MSESKWKVAYIEVQMMHDDGRDCGVVEKKCKNQITPESNWKVACIEVSTRAMCGVVEKNAKTK